MVPKFPTYGIVPFMMGWSILLCSLFSPTASSFLDGNTIIYIVVLCALVGVITVLLVIVSCCLCISRRRRKSMYDCVCSFSVVCYKQWFYLCAGKLNFLMSDVKTKMWVTHLLNCVACTNWVYFICYLSSQSPPSWPIIITQLYWWIY